MCNKIFLNLNTPNNVSFYSLMKHWILHIACISPPSWFKMFVLFKFYDYSKLNLEVERQNWMAIDAHTTRRPPAAFPHIRCIKKLSGFYFKLSSVLKTVVAFFSEIYPGHSKGKRKFWWWFQVMLQMFFEQCAL